MDPRASGVGMAVGKYSRLQRGVGVLAMPDARLDTTRGVESVGEISPGAGVLRLIVPGMVVGVIIERRCVPDGVEVTRSVISATPEFSSKTEGVEF
jgi:hypothetical protein